MRCVCDTVTSERMCACVYVDLDCVDLYMSVYESVCGWVVLEGGCY
jgi:hypothetical protein